MGDVGEDYRALDEWNKQKKQERKVQNMEIINTCGLRFSIDSSGSVLFKTAYGTVCFYPTTNKLMHKNKVMRGDANRAIAYVKNLTP